MGRLLVGAGVLACEVGVNALVVTEMGVAAVHCPAVTSQEFPRGPALRRGHWRARGRDELGQGFEGEGFHGAAPRGGGVLECLVELIGHIESASAPGERGSGTVPAPPASKNAMGRNLLFGGCNAWRVR